MSAIDRYKHNYLGYIDFSEATAGSKKAVKEILIYELLEDVPADDEDFDGRIGDIIVGGGSREVPAFRIAIPEAIYFFTDEDWDDFDTHEDLFKAFWTSAESVKMGENFAKLGWTPDYPIEFWLAENVCLMLIENIEKYFEYYDDRLLKSKLRFSK